VCIFRIALTLSTDVHTTQISTVLFLPTISICMNAFLCTVHKQCEQAEITIPVGVVAILAFGTLTLCVSGLCFDFDGQQQARNALARGHSRFEVICLALQAAVMLVFHLDISKSSELVLTLLFTGAHLIMAAIHTWYQPYIVRRVQATRTVLAWLLTWLGACSVITVALDDDSDRSGVLLFYLATPPLALLCIMVVSSRRSQVLKMPPDQLRDVYEV